MKSTGIQRQRLDNCVKNSSVTKRWERNRWLSANLQVKKVGLKRMERWRSTKETGIKIMLDEPKNCKKQLAETSRSSPISTNVQGQEEKW